MTGTNGDKKDSPSVKETDMPANMRKTTTGYQYRRVVPAELRVAIGKREIKKSLGKDYRQAKIRLMQLEVETDSAFASARAAGGSPADTSLQEYEQIPPMSRRLQKISATEPGLAERLGSLWLSTLQADHEARRSGARDSDECDELEESIRDGLQHIKRALARGNVSPYFSSVSTLLLGRGYELVGSSEDIHKLTYDFLKYVREGYDILARREDGEHAEPDMSKLQPPLPAAWEKTKLPVRNGPTWEEVLNYWLNERERPPRTKREATAFLNWFKDHCKKDPIDVRKGDITAWLQDERANKGNSAKTLEKKATLLGAIFSASTKDDKLPVNPFSGYDYRRFFTKKGEEKEDDREPFTTEELELIFSSEGIFTKNRRMTGGGGQVTRGWFTLLGYTTGARIDEIGELTADSVRVENKIPYIRISSGKNDNSVRDIPLHPEIIKLGFLDYIDEIKKSGHTNIWPNLITESEDNSKSAVFSKWFNRYIRNNLNIPSSKVFHSFRHNFVDICRNSGTPEDLRKSITGHISQDVGDTYGSGFSLETKYQAINNLKFTLNISSLFNLIKHTNSH